MHSKKDAEESFIPFSNRITGILLPMLLLNFLTPPSFAGSEINETQNSSIKVWDTAHFFTNLTSSTLIKRLKPAWVKDVNYGFSFRENLKPEYYLESTIPVHEDSSQSNVVFLQSRMSYGESDYDTYNMGAVWRCHLQDFNSLFGLNVFGDFQRDPGFGRVGLGADWLSHDFEARINSYYRMGPKRLIQETSTIRIYEQVLNGFDAEIGLRLPYFRNTKLFAGGEIYDFKYGKNLYAWTGRLEYRPTSNLVLNLYFKDHNLVDNVEWRFDIRYVVSESAPPNIPLKFDHSTPAEASSFNIKNRFYDQVERENRILKEKFGVGKNNGITFVIGRA